MENTIEDLGLQTTSYHLTSVEAHIVVEDGGRGGEEQDLRIGPVSKKATRRRNNDESRKSLASVGQHLVETKTQELSWRMDRK